MTLNGWLQILFFLLAIFLVTPLIGGYMARVFTRQRTWLDPVAAAARAADLPAHRRRRGARDAMDRVRRGVLLFGVVSMLVLYAMQRLQQVLPFNPQGFGAVAPALAFNTAASFTTNTNWQAYGGETTMSYFTQMAGLAYHNFVSAAVGIAVAIAFIRGIAQKEKDTLGNFWVDMVRASLWVLLPIAIVGALFLVSQGVVQNLRPYDKAAVIDPQTITTTGPTGSRRRRRARADDRAGAGRVAGDHQAVRHERRRLLQRQQRASVREPDAAHELPGDVRRSSRFRPASPTRSAR